MHTKKIRCMNCKSNLLNREVALSIKMLGRSKPEISCIHCLSNKLHIKTEVLIELSDYYERTGCEIFQRKYVEEGEA